MKKKRMRFIKIISFLTIFISALIQFGTTAHAKDKSVVKSQNQSMTEVKFNFEKLLVVLKLKQNKSNSKTLVSSSKNNSGVFLKILTPQFSAQPITEVPAVLITNFNGVETLKADIKALGFNESDLNEFTAPKQKKLDIGVLYSWMSPTFGSSDYYYLSSPDNSHLAFKLGPFASILAKDFEIDWEHTQWKKSVSDH